MLFGVQRNTIHEQILSRPVRSRDGCEKRAGFFGYVAQIGGALGLHPRGCRFNSDRIHQHSRGCQANQVKALV